MRWGKTRTPLAVMAVLTALAAVEALAQTVKTEVKSGEVMGVSGSLLTVRMPDGSYRQFDVPADFRFDLDGQMVPVGALTKGQRITAIITTTETPVQMMTAEVRNAEVVHAQGQSVVIRNEAGELKQYTIDDVKALGIMIERGGSPVTIYDLRKGDRISATIISTVPAQTLTSREVLALVDSPPPPQPRTAAAQVPPPAPAPAPAPATRPAPAATGAAAPAALPKTASSVPLIGLAGAVLLGVGLGLTALRRLHVGR